MIATRMKKFYFEVPKDLKQQPSQICIYGITIEGEDFVIEFVDTKDRIQRINSYITGDKHNDVDSVRKLVESRLSYFFDEAATAYCTGRLVDVIDKLYDTKAAHAIEKIKKCQKIEAARLDAQGGLVKEKPVYTVKKFSGVTTTSPNGVGLAEAVIIKGEPMFAVTINGGNDVTFFKELETVDMILRPPGKQEYPPESAIEFQSEGQLREFVSDAIEYETLYTLYKDVKKFYTKEYFVDTEPKNSTLLALFTMTSYFQDKFSTVHYIWNVGDNGSGKNSVIIIYSWLGYRVFYVSGASGANIREYLGTVEEGQGTIAEDEVDDLDKDSDKKRVYTTGYASGSCVPKILEGNTKAREQRYYLPYCQKMLASENLPSVKDAKGLLDRTFVNKCIKGYPKYNAKSTKERTKSAEALKLIAELQRLRKRLFVYRLVHFNDILDEVKGLSISGRALELTGYDADDEEKIFYDEILPSLSSFLKERMSRRNESLEGKLYPIINKMVNEQGETLENEKIFSTSCVEMGGKEIPNRSDAFYVEDLGTVVRRKDILKVLKEKFKAIPGRKILDDGSSLRAHIISKESLERIKASYEDPWEIKIVLEETYDQVSQRNQELDQYGSQINPIDEEEEPGSHEVDEDQKTSEQIENAQKGLSDNGENSASPGIETGLPGLVGQSYSIEEIILNKAILDEQGKNKGYFTVEDWKTAVMCLPIQHPYHCDEDQAEQMLYALLEDGKIKEKELGKYCPGI
jgi:hypothetical protein